MTGESWWKFVIKTIIKPISCVATLSYEMGCEVLLIFKNRVKQKPKQLLKLSFLVDLDF